MKAQIQRHLAILRAEKIATQMLDDTSCEVLEED
jgi:hypothetical protein